jgi:hypothetical protein
LYQRTQRFAERLPIGEAALKRMNFLKAKSKLLRQSEIAQHGERLVVVVTRTFGFRRLGN